MSKAVVLAGAGLLAMSAQATVVYNSITGQHGYNQCFQCFDTSGVYPGNKLPAIAELGDIIQLTGTARNLTNVFVGLEQTPYFDPRTSPYTLPYTVDATLKLYTVDALLNTTLISSKTVTGVNITGDGLFNLAFDFTGVTAPNKFYYGLSFANSTDVGVAGLRFSLWDYFDTSFGGDGQSVPVGTDPDTVVNSLNSVNSLVYGRMVANPGQLVSCAGNGLGVNDLCKGFTPAVRFDAVESTTVPEPGSVTLVLAALGLAGVASRRRA